jgi:thioredoxin-related protein
MTRRLHGSIVLLLFLVLACPAAAATGQNWLSWDAGLKEASESDKPILVDVYTGWCGWCKRMDRDVYSRPEVRDYLSKRFVTIKLDAESGEAAKYEGKAYTSNTLAARFRVSGYPTTIFLRSKGQHIANVPGYVPADRFLLLLRYIGEGHLDRGVSFDDFARQEQAH